ncbi:VOC family protein [Pseudalkalibacillus sp. JSM 102089]|uniref:VOC family protein n=1 Tax=Pseudalkalibacillus sp. JSM 102089 TaxID=3229856 RepID=UPI0035261A03
MIEGLYEAHLPVKDLRCSIQFYQSLGLELAWEGDGIAFIWIERHKSWLGLWEGEEYLTAYHPSLRHVAFRIPFEEMKNSVNWLHSKGIEAVPFGNRTSVQPFVRPNQGNASVYFKDPDGNSLEFMSFVSVPDELKQESGKFEMTKWMEIVRLRGEENTL